MRLPFCRIHNPAVAGECENGGERERERERGNASLQHAKCAKNDEFYTRYEDVEREMGCYAKQLEDKAILCNCDDPFESNFVKFFLCNFNSLHLKKLLATGYSTSRLCGKELDCIEAPYGIRVESTKGDFLTGDRIDLDSRSAKCFVIQKSNEIGFPIEGDEFKDKAGKTICFEAGDFRSTKSLELLDEADIVITNPPFSLFREYMAILIERKKQFIVMGNKNSITYKEIFPLLRDGKMWLGNTIPANFMTPDGLETKQSNGLCRWFTNMDFPARHPKLGSDERFEDFQSGYLYFGNEGNYPKYDNYDAIEVSKVKEIPGDYFGVMGVPVTYLDKHVPEWFEIVGMGEDNGRGMSGAVGWDGKDLKCRIKGKSKFKRIFIRRKSNPAIGLEKVA